MRVRLRHMDFTPRLAAYIARKYGVNAPHVVSLLRSVPTDGRSPESDERICAAILIVGHGDLHRLRKAVTLARQDWRDVLVPADLASENWRDRLSEWLANQGHT